MHLSSFSPPRVVKRNKAPAPTHSPFPPCSSPTSPGSGLRAPTHPPPFILRAAHTLARAPATAATARHPASGVRTAGCSPRPRGSLTAAAARLAARGSAGGWPATPWTPSQTPRRRQGRRGAPTPRAAHLPCLVQRPAAPSPPAGGHVQELELRRGPGGAAEAAPAGAALPRAAAHRQGALGGPPEAPSRRARLRCTPPRPPAPHPLPPRCLARCRRGRM